MSAEATSLLPVFATEAKMRMPMPVPANSAMPILSMPATTAAARPYSSVSKPSVASLGHADERGLREDRQAGQQAGQRPGDRADALDRDAEQRGPLGVLGRGAHGHAHAAAGEEQRQPGGEQADDEEREDLVARQDRLAAGALERQARPRRLDHRRRSARSPNQTGRKKPRTAKVCARPIVTTVTIRRGLLAKRRITTMSVSAPTSEAADDGDRQRDHVADADRRRQQQRGDRRARRRGRPRRS